MESTFGNWLLSELKKHKMTQTELARLAGLGSGTISNIMSGEKKIGPETATAIAHVLRVHPKLVFEKAGLLPPSTDDPWAEQMNHKISQLTGSRREMAERLLDTLLDEQDRELNQTPKAKTARP